MPILYLVPPDPCPDAEVLVAFVSGELDETGQEELEEHVDRCPRCRVALSEAGRHALGSRPALTEPSDAVDPEHAEGARLGRYELVERLGAGAMGVVYRARDPELGREVAVKIVRGRPDQASSELLRTRTLREARAIARIAHPNVVAVFDVGTWNDSVYVAMELVAGQTVLGWLAEAPRSWSEIAVVFAQCARGLAAAHEVGVVHRDFKPANALVGQDGRVRVTDFGLARADGAVVEDPVGESPQDLRATWTGSVLGTPAYMAPEQHRGDTVDARADQFALCVALWEALHGKRPFTGDSSAALLAAIEGGKVEAPPRSRAPSWLRRAALRGLAARPEDRFASMADLSRAIQPRRRRSVLVAASVAGLFVGAAGFYAVGQGSERDPCATVTSDFDRVWSSERRQGIARVFAESKLAYLTAVGERALAGADALVEKGRALRIDVCRAGVERGERDAATRARQIACIEQSLVDLDALASTWETGEGKALEGSVSGIGRLDSLDHCANVTALASEPEVPSNSEAQPRWQELKRKLSQANASASAGQYREAVAAITEVAESADREGMTALHAQALLNRGMVERELGQFAEARRTLTAAAAAAERAASNRLRAKAWIQLVEVSGDDAVEIDEAERALTLADSVVTQLGDPMVAAALDAARGRLLLRKGKIAEAIGALQRSVEGHTLPPIEESARRNVLATAYSARGDYATMLAELEKALSLAENAVGTEHPKVASILNNMIEPYFFLDRFSDAIAVGERSLEILEGVYGKEHPRVAAALDNHSILLHMAGATDKAIALSQRSLAISEKTIGRDHTDVATTQLNLASLYKDSERYHEALIHYQRAVDIWSAALGPEHADIANALTGAAKAHLGLGQPALALELAEKGLAIRDKQEVNPSDLAQSKFLVARALRENGDEDHRARRLAREALAIYATLGEREHSEVEKIESWLVEPDHRRGR